MPEPEHTLSDEEFERSLTDSLRETAEAAVLKPFPSLKVGRTTPAFKEPQPTPTPTTTPTNRNKIVADAVNEDFERSSHSMQQQMEVIIAGLEREIAEAKEIQATVAKRIKDLNLSLDASKAALDVLKRKKE
jgi:hypothetical protein